MSNSNLVGILSRNQYYESASDFFWVFVFCGSHLKTLVPEYDLLLLLFYLWPKKETADRTTIAIIKSKLCSVSSYNRICCCCSFRTSRWCFCSWAHQAALDHFSPRCVCAFALPPIASDFVFIHYSADSTIAQMCILL